MIEKEGGGERMRKGGERGWGGSERDSGRVIGTEGGRVDGESEAVGEKGRGRRVERDRWVSEGWGGGVAKKE